MLIVGAEKYTLVPAGKPKAIDFFRGGMGMMALMGGAQAEDSLRAAGILPPKEAVAPLENGVKSGWNPVQLLPRFGGQVVKCGSLQAFAPLLLPDKSPKKEKKDTSASDSLMELVQSSLASLGGARLLPLVASLSPNQLNQATSDTGLPLSSLSAAQRKLVQPLLPRTAEFRFQQAPGLPPTKLGETPPLIPAADQAQFALRLRRSIQLAPSMAESGIEAGQARFVRQAGNLITPPTTPGGSRELALKPGGNGNPMALIAKLFGGMEPQTMPARRKATELDTRQVALNAPVSLVGVSTVEELVQRVAKATKVSVFADQRIGKLSVASRGTTARAGDVLDALCWAVGGAVRRISDTRESVYLLTEQVPIPESELGELTEQLMGPMTGMMESQKSAERLAVEAKARLIRQKTLMKIPRRPADGVPESLWTVAESLKTAKNPEANQVPLTELPKELQDRALAFHKAMGEGIRAAVAAGAPGGAIREPQALTQVSCTQSLVAELVAPTLGAVAVLSTADAGEIHPDLPAPTPPPAVALPESLKVRAALVPLPKTEEEAAALVALASARGLTELRVPVGPSAEAEKALGALTAKALGKVGVVPILSPLAPVKPEAPRDRSFDGLSLTEWLASPRATKLFSALPEQLRGGMGRTYAYDYAPPELANVGEFAIVAKRLSRLPGVTGIALENLAAPGYRETSGVGAMSGAGPMLWQGGANDQERVAFVREQHADPAELGAVSLMDMFSSMAVRTAWGKRTTARSDYYLKRLSEGLAMQKLAVPLSTVYSGEPPRWESWQGTIPKSPSLSTGSRPALRVLSFSRFLSGPNAFFSNEFAGLDEPEQFAGFLGKELAKLNASDAEVRWDGVVIDLGDVPLASSLTLLERVIAVK